MKGSEPSHRKKKSKSLRDEVRDALLDVIRDAKAPPTAKAVAGRALVNMMGDGFEPGAKKPAAELSIEELDEEIASITQP